MPSPARIDFAVDYSPSSDEQREATALQRNRQRLAAWHLKQETIRLAWWRALGKNPARSEVPLHVA